MFCHHVNVTLFFHSDKTYKKEKDPLLLQCVSHMTLGTQVEMQGWRSLRGQEDSEMGEPSRQLDEDVPGVRDGRGKQRQQQFPE